MAFTRPCGAYGGLLRQLTHSCSPSARLNCVATSCNGHQAPKTTRKGRILSMPKIAQVFEQTRNGRYRKYYSAFGSVSGLTRRACTRLQPMSKPKLGGFKPKRPRNAKNHFRGQNYAPNRYCTTQHTLERQFLCGIWHTRTIHQWKTQLETIPSMYSTFAAEL